MCSARSCNASTSPRSATTTCIAGMLRAATTSPRFCVKEVSAHLTQAGIPFGPVGWAQVSSLSPHLPPGQRPCPPRVVRSWDDGGDQRTCHISWCPGASDSLSHLPLLSAGPPGALTLLLCQPHLGHCPPACGVRSVLGPLPARSPTFHIEVLPASRPCCDCAARGQGSLICPLWGPSLPSLLICRGSGFHRGQSLVLDLAVGQSLHGHHLITFIGAS